MKDDVILQKNKLSFLLSVYRGESVFNLLLKVHQLLRLICGTSTSSDGVTEREVILYNSILDVLLFTSYLCPFIKKMFV